ncbi:MAG: HAMP domain-containing histidine kinase [Alphaproteobacteria bacterium]|nr:HAMP domain-containing histidine kinase [Alphaproteobacteria bacterium]
MRRHHHRSHRAHRAHHRRMHHRMHQSWHLVRGIHRRVVSFLVLAAAFGGIGGWALHTVHPRGPLPMIAVLAVILLMVWPLTWMATFRIARPMRELARVAHALREGELSRKDELVEGDDEVGQVADALHVMADRISTQLDDQRALMAAVSHELRSPLGRIRVLVELAREGLAPDDLHDSMQAEIDGMDALVGDLLAASRIDFEAVQPGDLVAADVARRALELAGVSEAVLTADPGVRVHADPTLLTRALRVMLDNAVRYGTRVVALRVRGDGHEVAFEVDDDGPGFREGEEEQVFEPFWRRPPEPGEAPKTGVGLGLALVRRIAEAHDGSASASNRGGGGATVCLRLPAASGGPA